MFFKTEKKLRALMHDIMTVRHALLDKEAFIIEKINDTEKHITQLEKRINTLSDYIQGSYTKQINQNFAEIQMQIDMIKPKEITKYMPQIKTKKTRKTK